MNKATKRLLSAVFCAVFALSFCLFSSALSTNEYGLGLSVKGEESDASATLNIKLKNSNRFDVNGVCIDLTIPEGLDLEQAKKNSDGYSVLVDTLTAGEVYENGFVFVSREAAPVSADTTEESNTLPVIFAATAIFAVVALAAILVFRKKKAAALMLAVLMFLPCAGVFGVHAIGKEDMKSFQLKETVSINGKDYPVIITVSYLANSAKNSYFDFDVNEDTYLNHVETVTRLTTDISGVAVANGSVKSVSYAVKSEATGNTVTGEAQLDGCDWSIEKLAFVPGDNEVTVTAELDSGDKQTETYNINYDRGEIYRAKESEIREENGHRYVDNIINIYFTGAVSEERKEEILNENSLVRIGEMNGVFLVQARADVKGFDELEALCLKIQSLDEVRLAVTENIVELELDSVPNDPWYHNTNYIEKWNETLPNGNNWSVEAVEAISAWEYESYFGTAMAGVVDGGFKTNHEDYATNLIAFPTTMYQTGNEENNHGTHVAGIIGATRNNGLGASGLLKDVKIYAASYTVGNSSNTITNVVDAVVCEIEHGATAVNISLGLSKGDGSDGTNPYLDKTYTEVDLASTAGPCATALYALINDEENAKEFVVVQSAGNGNIDTRVGSNVFRSDKATQNGLFCSITPDVSSYVRYRYYDSLSKNDIQQVYNRIIVVGAIRNHTTEKGAKFYMWERSNGGERVDIYAPGHQVFSTIAGAVEDGVTYKYAFMSGTSQAAPIVTSVAAMCFAINPDFTGEQVKNIICDDANTTHTALDYELGTGVYDENGNELDYHPFEGNGKVVSMKLCAEAALRTVCGPANYRYFNTIKNAADKLNPNDYKNFEVVQSVLDSIGEDFYALYEFEQEKVTAKANELVNAMDKLVERGEANYTEVEKAKTEAAALDPTHYVDFSGVTAAVNAVVYGKYADEQAQVDLMAKNIRDAIAALEPLAKISSRDTNVTPDNTEMLVVIPPDYVGDLAEYLSAGKLTVTHKPNSKGTYSTGSTITLSDERGKISDKIYTVVTLGDVDGDAKADGSDAFIVGLYISGMLPVETAAETICCDVDFNGIIDEEDFAVLERCGLFEDYISNLYQGS